jgi:hypothetical protein
MKKTAPSTVEKPLVSVQLSKSIPTEDMAPGTVAGPVSPMVMKLSNSQSGTTAKKAGLTGPMSVPNGAAAWNAGGMLNGAPPCSP